MFLNINFSHNVGVNEQIILDELLKNPKISANELVLILSKSRRTAERSLKILQENGYIERVGSDKNGHWKILK